MDPVIGRPPMAPPIAPAPIRPRRTSRPRSPPQKAKWVHWILLAAFTVVILGVGMVLGSLIKPSAGKRDWSMERSPFYSPIVPISDNRRFSLNPNKKYFGAPSVENDAAWENICGEEGGRVAISDKRVLRNLPQSIQGANKGEQIYGIGVCYQLHCLRGSYVQGGRRYALLESGKRDRVGRCSPVLEL
ncbi:hypothetical protein L873DRAFT_1849402 [Choiromyces venosus 120613-1]|uniref:Uncharacterized protein n=1 Tax=Choiromyces venosus 120613-1 TaxID=1336337 RepID=A0A3N4IYF2_9PEZI|nr:hypothetical protein L873DRAFT_1849402 [Choiromyces venosus 120613-1]